MKIGINARFLNKPYTGIFEQTKNLFGTLAKLDKKNKYIFVVPEKIDKKLADAFSKNVSFKVLPEKSLGTAGMKKTWWEQIQLTEFFSDQKFGMVIYPYPSNPWTKDWYDKGIKTVLCVHDCITWTNQNYRKGMLSNIYHNQSKKAAKLADVILTVSNFSKKEIESVCEVDGSKIKVIYNDADETYKKHALDNAILQKFGLKSKKYFLYVGGYDERKNVDFLTGEFESFARKNKDVCLVLAGGKILNQKLYKSFENKTSSNVVRTGFLGAEELADLYANCLAFVSMSKKEGFNIPIVEAANCGAPLILSDIEVHKEIAGENAMFVNIEKKGSLGMAMNEFMKKEVAIDFAKKSVLVSKKYSWQNSAKKLKNVLFS